MSQLGTGLHSNKGENLGQDCTPTKESTWDRIALQQRRKLGTGLHSNEGVNLGQDCTPTKESTWDRIALQRRSQLGTMGPKLTLTQL